MNIENYIKSKAEELKRGIRQVEVAPEINEEHIKVLKKKYAAYLNVDFEKYILVLSYTGQGWIALTGDALYYDNFLQNGFQKIMYKSIIGVTARKGNIFMPDAILLKTHSSDIHLDACIDGLNINVIKSIFEKIITMSQNCDDDFTISKQGLLSYQIPDELKLLYLKILCNYAYINDSQIDSNEYNSIISFSIRMELKEEERKRLREYMNNCDNREKTGVLLSDIKRKTQDQTGYWDAIKFCLMQDILYIHEIQSPGKSWKEDGFIGSLLQHCDLRMNQVDTMVSAVFLNKKMLQKDADMKHLRQEWDRMLSKIKDTAGYVPIRYLFCSGSVYSLKSYEFFLKRNDTSQKAINKQRELILHELIINNQKSVNVLVGDMNYLAERLEKALLEEDKIKQEYKEVKKLLERIKAAFVMTKQNEEYKVAIDRVENDEV